MELYYRRKSRNDSAKTQTVVIFLPDVRSCVPTRVEWDELNAKYKQHFETSMKKGGDDVDNNSSVDGGDTASAENLHGTSINENGSADVGVPTDGDGVHAVIERSELADGESTTANNNEKALQLNSLLLTLLLLFYIENISNLEIYPIVRIELTVNTINLINRRPKPLEILSLGITIFTNQNPPNLNNPF